MVLKRWVTRPLKLLEDYSAELFIRVVLLLGRVDNFAITFCGNPLDTFTLFLIGGSPMRNERVIDNLTLDRERPSTRIKPSSDVLVFAYQFVVRVTFKAFSLPILSTPLALETQAHELLIKHPFPSRLEGGSHSKSLAVALPRADETIGDLNRLRRHLDRKC